MTIERNQPNQAQASISSGYASQQAPQAEQARGEARGFSLLNASVLFDVQVQRGSISQNLKRLAEGFTEVFKQYQDRLDIRVLTLDVEHNVELSKSLIVVAAGRRGDLREVAYHTLIMEGNDPVVKSEVTTFNNETIEIPRYTDSVWEPRLKEFLNQKVLAAFGPSVKNLTSIEAEVVRASFDVTDIDRVRDVGVNALIAINTWIEIATNRYAGLNLARLQNNAQLQSRVTFSPEKDSVDVQGNAVRADVIVTMTAQGTNNSQNPDRTEVVSTVKGYPDLAWSPAQPAAPQGFSGFQGYGQQAPSTLYAPVFVITELETPAVQATDGQLLALVNALAINTESREYVRALRPRPATAFQKGEIDLNDIGNIGYESPQTRNPETGKHDRFNTKSDAFNDEQFYTLLNTHLSPSLTIAHDIDRAGPSTWANVAFVDAARGSKAAAQEIVRAADVLTNGHFSRIYAQNKGSHAFAYYRGPVHRGTFRLPSGEDRDIRGIGYLAIAALVGATKPGLLAEWTNTFYAMNVPENVRLAQRLRIMSNLFTVNVFGLADRIEYEAVFLQSLAEGAAAAGLTLRSQYAFSDLGRGRATASFQGAGFQGAVQSPVFTTQFGSTTGVGNARPTGFGRYGA